MSIKKKVSREDHEAESGAVGTCQAAWVRFTGLQSDGVQHEQALQVQGVVHAGCQAVRSARYFGGAKTHAQMAMTAIAKTLLKAADNIQLIVNTIQLMT